MEAYYDHLNLIISDRRYTINQIAFYQEFVRRHLQNDETNTGNAILTYVIKNYILRELFDNLQVEIFRRHILSNT